MKAMNNGRIGFVRCTAQWWAMAMAVLIGVSGAGGAAPGNPPSCRYSILQEYWAANRTYIQANRALEALWDTAAALNEQECITKAQFDAALKMLEDTHELLSKSANYLWAMEDYIKSCNISTQLDADFVAFARKKHDLMLENLNILLDSVAVVGDGLALLPICP